LCFIVDHLLCPDTQPLLHQLQKSLVHAGVTGQLRMERGDQEAAVAKQHRHSIVAGEKTRGR